MPIDKEVWWHSTCNQKLQLFAHNFSEVMVVLFYSYILNFIGKIRKVCFSGDLKILFSKVLRFDKSEKFFLLQKFIANLKTFY